MSPLHPPDAVQGSRDRLGAVLSPVPRFEGSEARVTSALRPRGQCRAAAAAAVAAESQGELKAMTLKTGIGNQEKSHVIAS
jgi:hypothetical protein